MRLPPATLHLPSTAATHGGWDPLLSVGAVTRAPTPADHLLKRDREASLVQARAARTPPLQECTLVPDEPAPRSHHRVLTLRAIVIGGIVLFLIAVGSVVALFLTLGSGTPADTVRLDVIRTASSIV